MNHSSRDTINYHEPLLTCATPCYPPLLSALGAPVTVSRNPVGSPGAASSRNRFNSGYGIAQARRGGVPGPRGRWGEAMVALALHRDPMGPPKPGGLG